MYVSIALFTHNVNLIFMCRIIWHSTACCAALPFGTLSYKQHEIRRRFIEYKLCVLIFCTSFVWNISHSEKNLANYYHKSKQIFMKLIVLFSEFIRTWICIQILEVLKYKILWIFVRCERSFSERTDGRTAGQMKLTK